MKKTALFLGLLLIIMSNVNAQEKSNYGFYLGCGVNWMKLDKSFFYDDSEVEMTNEVIHLPDTIIVNPVSAEYLEVKDAKTSPNASFMIGGFYEYQATNLFGLQFELMYNQYGYKLSGYVEREDAVGQEVVTYNYKSNMKLSNLSAAVLLKFHLFKECLSIDLGVQPSLCLRAVKEAHRSINTKETLYTSGTDYRPVNVSLVGGVTGCIAGHVLIGARYNYGLLDVLYAKTAYLDSETKSVNYNYTSATSKTSSVQISVGFKF